MGRPAKNMDTGGHPALSNCKRCKEGRLHYTASVGNTLEDMYECDLCGQPVFAAKIEGKWETFYPYVDSLINEKKRDRPKTWSPERVIRRYKEMCDERRKARKHEGLLPDDQRHDRS